MRITAMPNWSIAGARPRHLRQSKSKGAPARLLLACWGEPQAATRQKSLACAGRNVTSAGASAKLSKLCEVIFGSWLLRREILNRKNLGSIPGQSLHDSAARNERLS